MFRQFGPRRGDPAGQGKDDALRVPGRSAVDAEACVRICYEGFKAFNERHGFPPNYPSIEAATARVQGLLKHPAVFGVVAVDQGGCGLGFDFLSERSPILVDSAAQGEV